MKTATDDAVTEFTPTHLPIPDEGLTERGRRSLLQNLVAEQGFAHRQLPLGAGLTLQANGNMTPRDEDYRKMLYERGISAQAGERVAITSIDFKGDRIVLDFNGGPYAKHRFLSHLSLNDQQIAPQGPTATGCRITLVFEGGIPEISAAEVKALLDPIVDFKAKTSEEAYADTLPPKVREAVASHDVLVGMTKRMVLAALGAPHDKEREHTDPKNPNSPHFEEWIYGQPPQATKFVRFRGDRVVRLEIAEVGKPIEIHDKNEIGGDTIPLQTRTIASGDSQPDEDGRHQTTAPTLLKPGEGHSAATPASAPSNAPAPPNAPATTAPKLVGTAHGLPSA